MNRIFTWQNGARPGASEPPAMKEFEYAYAAKGNIDATLWIDFEIKLTDSAGTVVSLPRSAEYADARADESHVYAEGTVPGPVAGKTLDKVEAYIYGFRIVAGKYDYDRKGTLTVAFNNKTVGTVTITENVPIYNSLDTPPLPIMDVNRIKCFFVATNL